mmetsp:Transcript_60551/g.161568  ORF Transcript_60551/g.161568 Transcript_60551/m.161568 type:complete len:352 (+) Transcript_60551:231-1286(+)
MDSGVVGARMGGAVGGAGPQVSVNSFHGVVDSPADFTRSASSDFATHGIQTSTVTDDTDSSLDGWSETEFCCNDKDHLFLDNLGVVFDESNSSSEQANSDNQTFDFDSIDWVELVSEFDASNEAFVEHVLVSHTDTADAHAQALAPVAMTSPAVLAPAVVRVRLFEAPCKPAPAQSIRDTDAARTPRAAHGQRGLHVRGRPDMSRAARDGAAHWARMLSDVRAAWEKAADAFPADFHTQAEAAHGRIRAKLECLLRTLHLAAADGLLIPRLAEGGPSAGFLGWTGFVVAPGAGAAVRGAVQALLPAAGRLRGEEALREVFRQAGLVPAGWRWADAWAGAVCFVRRLPPRGE